MLVQKFEFCVVPDAGKLFRIAFKDSLVAVQGRVVGACEADKLIVALDLDNLSFDVCNSRLVCGIAARQDE